MKKLPKNVQVYKKTSVFCENSTPAALLKDHLTKAGFWAKISILKGKLQYVLRSDPTEEIELNFEKFGVVEPEVLHHVKLNGHVKFFIEFLK